MQRLNKIGDRTVFVDMRVWSDLRKDGVVEGASDDAGALSVEGFDGERSWDCSVTELAVAGPVGLAELPRESPSQIATTTASAMSTITMIQSVRFAVSTSHHRRLA